MRFVTLALLFCIGNIAFAIDDPEQLELLNRIKPVGTVRIEGKKMEAPQKIEEVPVAMEPGQKVYETYCMTCHKTGLAGAPLFRDAKSWQTRMVKNLEQLTVSAIKGLNAMPPKGTCADCSPEDIRDAIKYMLPTS